MSRLAAVIALALALAGGAAEAAPPAPRGAAPAAKAAPATAAGADAEARRRFDRALELYRDGALDAALVELERAYALRPASKLLYNLAVVRRDLRRYADALETFETYLAEAGATMDRSRRAEVAREIDKLRGFVGVLRIEVTEAGAEVSVDDHVVGVSPLPGPVRVNVGQRRVTASRQGRQAATVIAVAGGDEVPVSLRIPRPAAAAAVVPAMAPAPMPPASRSSLKPWVAAGVTAALVVAAAVTGLAALDAKDELARTRFAGSTPSPAARDLESRASSLALATDLLLAGAAAGAGVTVWFLVRPEGEAGRAASVGAGVHWRF